MIYHLQCLYSHTAAYTSNSAKKLHNYSLWNLCVTVSVPTIPTWCKFVCFQDQCSNIFIPTHQFTFYTFFCSLWLFITSASDLANISIALSFPYIKKKWRIPGASRLRMTVNELNLCNWRACGSLFKRIWNSFFMLLLESFLENTSLLAKSSDKAEILGHFAEF